MQKTKIKFCGITNAHDAKHAVLLGVDAIGLIFFSGSKRAISAKEAKAIVRDLPPFLTKVGLFVNPTQQDVLNVLQQVDIDVLQFHGQETEAFCQQFNKPYIKAITITDDFHWDGLNDIYPSAKALLLDTAVKGQHGGTGISFKWKALPSSVTRPIIIAGGLTPDNVAKAINTMHPYAVDVSGGIEGKPGHKDYGKMKAFIDSVVNTDDK